MCCASKYFLYNKKIHFIFLLILLLYNWDISNIELIEIYICFIFVNEKISQFETVSDLALVSYVDEFIVEMFKESLGNVILCSRSVMADGKIVTA